MRDLIGKPHKEKLYKLTIIETGKIGKFTFETLSLMLGYYREDLLRKLIKHGGNEKVKIEQIGYTTSYY